MADSINGRKQNGRKVEEREPMPNTARCFPAGTIFPEASSTRRGMLRSQYLPGHPMQEYIIGVVSYALPLLQRCVGLLGRSITGKPALIRRKTLFGNAWH